LMLRMIWRMQMSFIIIYSIANANMMHIDIFQNNLAYAHTNIIDSLIKK